MRHRRILALVTLLGCLLARPTSAAAWCPSLTDGPPQPADFSACAPRLDRLPLAWRHRCTSLSLSSAAPSRALSDAQVRAVFRRALDQWQGADCGSGVTTGLDVAILEEANACTVGTHATRGPNVHTVVFIDDATAWSRTLGLDTRAYAVSLVWHDPHTGEIVDVDIEINEARGTLTDCPDAGCPASSDAVDLGNVVTHELGHYFGIAHTTADHPAATMFAEAPFGEIIKRDLDPDDIDAICTTYPAGTFDESCDATPLGGLGLDCQPGGGCGCAAVGARGSSGAVTAALVAALGMLFALRRGAGTK